MIGARHSEVHMSTQELADLFFGMIQEEVDESAELPWVMTQTWRGGWMEARFVCNRIGDVLHVYDAMSGDKFTLELKKV